MTTAVDTALVRDLGEAAARHIPASEDVRVLGSEDGVQLAGFAGAAVADLGDGRVVALCAGDELVHALATSPLGTLSLAAALQPSFDAVAAHLGGTAGAARDVLVEELPGLIADLAVTILLGGHAVTAALVVPSAGLGGAAPTPQPSPEAPASAPARGIEMLHGVVMDVTVEIGRTRMPVRDLLSLAPGAVVELDRAAGSPADLLVNGRLIARGEVVVVDEDYALRITEILDPSAAH
ncbi:flagellar motor switch protein FliN [Aeromicrobium phragmitis]|uniref:Flagellar motor switch protein FliN n=1 Tax=Aeromicrobium phragmitis TaxID=2478914 RepID=A0A3L8PMI3_9ACTN|nr:flagellar motor switch protein FliN [Aeromicrobium phragmitis]RLV56480.1 flagellar motor switch protein FliN [Aeromicrobium phragmitis]